MITITLCMIVKNEEKNLERCLYSLSGLMDEIIIVDTGSTDGTKEVAARFTSKIYEFPWCGDFSKARNYAATKASMEYIYSADADEILDEENQERFRRLKEVLLPEIEIVQMKYTNQLEFGTTYNFDEEYRPKLWKRLRNFEWIDPVHETIRLEPVIYDSEIEIIHKPHESHAARDFSLIRQLTQGGEGLSRKIHNMYAKELFIAGTEKDFKEACPYFEADLKKNQPEGRLKETIAVLSKSYRIMGKMEHFFTVCLKDVASEPASEVCFQLGQFYEERKEYEEAAVWYYNAAFETTPLLDIRYGKQFPLEALVRVNHMLGDHEQEAYYRRLQRKEGGNISPMEKC